MPMMGSSDTKKNTRVETTHPVFRPTNGWMIAAMTKPKMHDAVSANTVAAIMSVAFENIQTSFLGPTLTEYVRNTNHIVFRTSSYSMTLIVGHVAELVYAYVSEAYVARLGSSSLPMPTHP